MGATIAWNACSVLKNLKNLVLWEPVLGGEHWLVDLKKLHNEFLTNAPVSARSLSLKDECLGFLIPDVVQRELCKIDYDKNEVPQSCRIHLIVSRQSKGSGELMQRITSLQNCGFTHNMDVEDIWNDVRLSDRVIMNNQALPTIVNIFSGISK
jgi:hypothetical protein